MRHLHGKVLHARQLERRDNGVFFPFGELLVNRAVPTLPPIFFGLPPAPEPSFAELDGFARLEEPGAG